MCYPAMAGWRWCRTKVRELIKLSTYRRTAYQSFKPKGLGGWPGLWQPKPV